MKSVEIRKLTHELRLFGMHESFERRCAEAAQEGLLGEELLARLLEDEKLNRKNKASKML